jgi:hypothetical protein
MSKQTAHMIMESVDMVDSELHEEAAFTLAQAELDGDNEDEWDDILLAF